MRRFGGFVRADLLSEIEEALSRIDYAEFQVQDWNVKSELDIAKKALYRLKEKLEEVGA